MENHTKYVDFRETEQDLLAAFLTNDAQSSAPNVIVSGYKSVGKTHVVLRHLENIGVRQTVVNCDEFITQKLLLQQCLFRIREDSGIDLSKYHQTFTYKGLEAARLSLLCETFAQFLMALEQFVVETKYREPHVLVLDRFDQCLDNTDELFRAFVRLREHSSIRNLSVVYILSYEEPPQLVTVNVPHIRFSPYTPEQVVEILVKTPFPDVSRPEVGISFWTQFTKLVVDLFFDYTGSDLSLLVDMCANLWPKFVSVIDQGRYSQNEFLQIYRELKDDIVKDDVLSNCTVTMYENGFLEEEASLPLSDLPYHSKFILIAGYLASYTNPKNDPHLFSRLRTLRARKSPQKGRKSPSKRQEKSTPRKLVKGPQLDFDLSPSKSNNLDESGPSPSKRQLASPSPNSPFATPKKASASPKKSGPSEKDESTIRREDIDTRLLSASYFDLERLKAILSVIYRNESRTLLRDSQKINLYSYLTEREHAKKDQEFNTFTLNSNMDINLQIATLAGLGLFSCSFSRDPLSTKIRWKCNVGWDSVEQVAREIKFPLHHYVMEE